MSINKIKKVDKTKKKNLKKKDQELTLSDEAYDNFAKKFDEFLDIEDLDSDL